MAMWIAWVRARSPGVVGEIVFIESREGRRTQYDYAVNLRLLSVRDGVLSQKTKFLTKQFEKGLWRVILSRHYSTAASPGSGGFFML